MPTAQLTEELEKAGEKIVGSSMLRVEDAVRLTGKAQYTDDISLPGMLRCVLMRSPFAHARIKRIDVSKALELPGVYSVLTGEDAAKLTTPLPARMPGFTGYCLAYKKVRFSGEPVVAIAAQDLETGENAMDLVEIEYDPLPPVLDAVESMKDGSPLIFEEKGTNVPFHKALKYGDVDEAFANADKIVSRVVKINRHHGTPLEPAASIAAYETGTGLIRVWSNIHQTRMYSQGEPARTLKINSGKYIHTSPNTGGAFGTKMGAMVYDIITSLLSMKTGRPVKYIEDRQENFTGNYGHAPERVYTVQAAVKSDGTILGLRINLVDDIGAETSFSGGGAAIKPLVGLVGPYRIKAVEYEISSVLTNKNPQSPYRGLGQGPHNFMLERIVDAVAESLGMDQVEIRRRNFIQSNEFPYTIPSGNVYDSGDYPSLLDLALRNADIKDLRRQQLALREEGRYMGIGISCTVEPGALGTSVFAVGSPDPSKGSTVSPEWLSASILSNGDVIVQTRFANWGTNPDTTLIQVIADELGVNPSSITVNHVGSDVSPVTFGPAGSRGCVALSDSAVGVSEKLKDKMIRIAAHRWQVSPSDVAYKDGAAYMKDDPGMKMTVKEIVAIAYAYQHLMPDGMEPGMTASFIYNSIQTAPDKNLRARSYHTMGASCHVVAVETDIKTGKVKIMKYFETEDCGVQINPKNVEAQSVGGIAQAIGLAFQEGLKYNEDGQLVTVTFEDYPIPSFYEMPETIRTDSMITPSPFTKTGAKGAAEGSFMTALPVLAQAVEDSLRPFKVKIDGVPMEQESIWQLVRDQKNNISEEVKA